MDKKPHISEFCSIVNIDGQQWLVSPKGELIKTIVWTDVMDFTGQPAVAIIKLLVNIGHPDEEAIKQQLFVFSGLHRTENQME